MGDAGHSSIVAVATAFAQAGFHAFTFDYRNLGESEGEIRQLVSVSGQQEDLLQAIRYIKKHPAVDETRLGLWGSSLGGGHVISVAAQTKDVSAVIAQIPFNGFPKKRAFLMANFEALVRDPQGLDTWKEGTFPTIHPGGWS